MRHRVLTDWSNSSTYDTRWCYSDGYLTPQCASTSYTTNYYVSAISQSIMKDISTPEYKRLIAEGHIINNPMYQEHLQWTGNPHVVEGHWKKLSANHNTIQTAARHVPSSSTVTMLDKEDYLHRLGVFLAEFSAERSIAVTQAWANVDESKMMALATIGELPETVRWLASIYRRLIDLMRLFLGRRKALIKRTLRKTGTQRIDEKLDFWMEMRYALRPLCYEAFQLASVFSKEEDPIRHTARGFHTTDDSDTTESWVFNDAYEQLKAVTTVERVSKYRTGVLYEINLEKGDLVTVLGLDQGFAAWWELTTLSFALDWLFNIGDIIQSISVSSGLSPLTSWCTETHVFQGHVETEYSASSYGDWQHDYSSDIQVGREEWTYTVKARSPNPNKSYVPRLRINLDWKKCVDLAAISRSIYRAIRKV